MCCEHIMCTNHKKFLPWEITCVFTKREETFLGESFLRNFPGKCRDRFSWKSFSCKSFSRKYHDTNFIKVWFTGCNSLYRYKLLVILWWNFVVKISRRENFGKSGKLPDGKISPRDFPRDFRVFSGNRAVNRGEKVASGEFPGNFSTSFSDISGETTGKTFFGGSFSRKFPPKVLQVKFCKKSIYRLQPIIHV